MGGVGECLDMVGWGIGVVNGEAQQHSWKRQLHGTYISVEPFNLFRYLEKRTPKGLLLSALSLWATV